MPAVLCACGCGQPAPIAQRCSPRRGIKRGDQLSFVVGHHARAKSLIAQYTVDPLTGCWNYNGSLTNNGYGERKKLGSRRLLAHRWHYEQKNGPVPEGMQLDHTCRNRRCVNPDHLEPVTPIENTRRSTQTKLSATEVDEIRARLASGEQQRPLARQFGVSQAQINRINRGHSWRA